MINVGIAAIYKTSIKKLCDLLYAIIRAIGFITIEGYHICNTVNICWQVML